MHALEELLEVLQDWSSSLLGDARTGDEWLGSLISLGDVAAIYEERHGGKADRFYGTQDKDGHAECLRLSVTAERTHGVKLQTAIEDFIWDTGPRL